MYASKRIPTLVAAAVAALVIMVGTALSLFAAERPVITLPTGDAYVQPFDRMGYLLDPDSSMRVEQLIADQSAFKPITTDWIDFGEQRGRIWLVARIQNGGTHHDRWFIDLQRQWFTSLAIYKAGDDGTIQTLLELDTTSDFEKRPMGNRYISLPLTLKPHEITTIFVAFQARSGSWLPLTFATPERYFKVQIREARINWALNGAVMAMIAIALAMGPVTGWGLVVSYAIYATASALIIANYEGYLFQYLWPESPDIFDPLNLVLIIAVIAAGIQFCWRFTAREEPNRWQRPLVHGISLFLPLLAVPALLYPDNEALHYLVYMLVPLGALAYLGFALLGLRRKRRGALPFFLGAATIALTAGFTTFAKLYPGSLAFSLVLDYMHRTLVLEGLLFLLAMILRVISIRDELNRSLKAELKSTSEKLELSQALAESKRKYDETRRLADSHRSSLAAMAHDLQQPLMSLRHGLDALGSKQAADRDGAEKLAAAVDYLESLTTRTLDDTNPAKQKDPEAPDVGKEEFPVSIILDNCLAMFRKEAAARNIALTAETSQGSVYADPVILMRIVSNLISNAIKHSNGSKVLLAAEKGAGFITISVSDDGKGMSEDQIADLSLAYSKGSDSGGTGLGLHLVHEASKAQGITINAASKPGSGTTFTLRVPVKPTQ